MTIKIHQSLQEAGVCVYPSLTLGHMGPTSFHQAHPSPASLRDKSSICRVLVLQKWKKPQGSLWHIVLIRFLLLKYLI